MSDEVSVVAQRGRLTRRLRQALLKRESPRLQMTFLVAASGAAGFVASAGLLNAGLSRIPVRYVASVTIAYLVFLGLLYVWIRLRRNSRRSRDSSSPDAWIDADAVGVLDLGGSTPQGAAHGLSTGGGRFGGAGASGSWGGSTASSGSAASSDFDFSIDGDDAGIVIALAAAALVLLGASVWIVAMAPSLFAELLLDGVLSASLYRRLRRSPQRPWLETAVRGTILPFLLAAITLGIAGVVMERYAPEARSLGGVIEHLRR